MGDDHRQDDRISRSSRENVNLQTVDEDRSTSGDGDKKFFAKHNSKNVNPAKDASTTLNTFSAIKVNYTVIHLFRCYTITYDTIRYAKTN